MNSIIMADVKCKKLTNAKKTFSSCLKISYLWPLYLLLIIYTILEIFNFQHKMGDHSMHGGHDMHAAMDHGDVHEVHDTATVDEAGVNMNHNVMKHDGKKVLNNAVQITEPVRLLTT